MKFIPPHTTQFRGSAEEVEFLKFVNLSLKKLFFVSVNIVNCFRNNNTKFITSTLSAVPVRAYGTEDSQKKEGNADEGAHELHIIFASFRQVMLL